MKVRRGTSLLEFLVVISFTIGFLATATSFFITAKDHSQWTVQQGNHHRDAVRLSERFRNDCGIATDVRLEDSGSTITLSYPDKTTTIQYQANAHVLLRTTENTTGIVARETFIFGQNHQVSFQIRNNPDLIQCQLIRRNPGVENKSIIESSFDTLLGSRLIRGTSWKRSES